MMLTSSFHVMMFDLSVFQRLLSCLTLSIILEIQNSEIEAKKEKMLNSLQPNYLRVSCLENVYFYKSGMNRNLISHNSQHSEFSSRLLKYFTGNLLK